MIEPLVLEQRQRAAFPGAEFVKEEEEKGRLALHGAHFEIATGTLSVLNHSRGEFYPL